MIVQAELLCYNIQISSTLMTEATADINKETVAANATDMPTLTAFITQNSVLTRSPVEQLERTRKVLEMATGLESGKKTIVVDVTGVILQRLLDDIATEQRTAVGDKLVALDAQRAEVAATREKVFVEKLKTTKDGSEYAQAHGMKLLQDFKDTGRVTQAAIVGGGVLAGSALLAAVLGAPEWIVRRILPRAWSDWLFGTQQEDTKGVIAKAWDWIKWPAVTAAGWLGVLWFFDRLGGKGWGAFNGTGWSPGAEPAGNKPESSKKDNRPADGAPPKATEPEHPPKPPEKTDDMPAKPKEAEPQSAPHDKAKAQTEQPQAAATPNNLDVFQGPGGISVLILGPDTHPKYIQVPYSPYALLYQGKQTAITEEELLHFLKEKKENGKLGYVQFEYEGNTSDNLIRNTVSKMRPRILTELGIPVEIVPDTMRDDYGSHRYSSRAYPQGFKGDIVAREGQLLTAENREHPIVQIVKLLPADKYLKNPGSPKNDKAFTMAVDGSTAHPMSAQEVLAAWQKSNIGESEYSDGQPADLMVKVDSKALDMYNSRGQEALNALIELSVAIAGTIVVPDPADPTNETQMIRYSKGQPVGKP
jgi:hypothetical protein